jgi:hypothetical protein
MRAAPANANTTLPATAAAPIATRVTDSSERLFSASTEDTSSGSDSLE